MDDDIRQYPRRDISFRMEVEHQLQEAYDKHGSQPWTRHQFYAILLEEVDELWDAIKSDAPAQSVRLEMMQIVAMVFRYSDTCYRRTEL